MVAKKTAHVAKKTTEKVKTLPTKAVSPGKAKNVKGGAVNAFVTFIDRPSGESHPLNQK